MKKIYFLTHSHTNATTTTTSINKVFDAKTKTASVQVFEASKDDYKTIYNILHDNTKTLYNLINNGKAKKVIF